MYLICICYLPSRFCDISEEREMVFYPVVNLFQGHLSVLLTVNSKLNHGHVGIWGSLGQRVLHCFFASRGLKRGKTFVQKYIENNTQSPRVNFYAPAEVHDSHRDFLCWRLYHPVPTQARLCSFCPATGCWSDYHRAESTPFLFSLKNKQTFRKG